jgi:hypothetical protein
MTMLAAFPLLAALAAAQAAPPPLPDALAQISMDWGLCRGGVVVELSATGLTPAQVVERVSERCDVHAARLADAGVRHYGPAWRGEVETLRRNARASAAREVAERRAGRASSDPATAWGQCIGRQVRTVTSAPDREAAIERAFGACTREEEAVRRLVTARSSPADAEAQLALMRRLARERAFVPGGPVPR